MAGGSRERESEDDTQCRHCGLWFGQEGVLPHERTCDLASYDARKVELTDAKARVRAGLTTTDEDAPDGDLDDATVDVEDDTAEMPDGVASDPASTRPDDGADSGPETATDGGPRDLPEFSDSDEDSGDETSASGPECPACGAGDSYLVSVDVLPESVLAQGPGEKDVLCLACSSVDPDGTVTTETVDGDEVLRINAFDSDEVAA